MAKRKVNKVKVATKTNAKKVIKAPTLTPGNLMNTLNETIYAVLNGTVDNRTASTVGKLSQTICKVNAEQLKTAAFLKKISVKGKKSLLIG